MRIFVRQVFSSSPFRNQRNDIMCMWQYVSSSKFPSGSINSRYIARHKSIKAELSEELTLRRCRRCLASLLLYHSLQFNTYASMY